MDYKQEYQEQTNEEILEKIIVANLGSSEFFINKASIWSLCDYSKVKPEWVQQFIAKYRDQMSPLSIKEASRYLL